MYDKLTLDKSNGVQNVHSHLAKLNVVTGSDGLDISPPEGGYIGNIEIPARLMEWLVDLRLLRNIPLSYLVPDAKLLPTESIRFFHVDPTWVDRIIDGVFSTVNTATVDIVFSCQLLALSRTALDDSVKNVAKAKMTTTTWTADQPMTGMLIRSELVRRWPDMVIEGVLERDPITKKPILTTPILRAEPLSNDIYIVLFAGKPIEVTIKEPFTGLRFGVEGTSPNYTVNIRDKGGNPTNGAPAQIPFRSVHNRVIDFKTLANNCQSNGGNNSRQVALCLEQKPYAQQFLQEVEEAKGSRELPEVASIPLGNPLGKRVMKLDSLHRLAVQNTKVGGG